MSSFIQKIYLIVNYQTEYTTVIYCDYKLFIIKNLILNLTIIELMHYIYISA